MKDLLINIDKLHFSYNNELVIENLSLEVHLGEILVILGPSGCGKSTLLRLIAGLEQPQQGEITICQSEERDRGLRFLFQDYDAFPWYTVKENVRNSASQGHTPADSNVLDILGRVGLGDSLNKYPGELSGGMRKRLALARCLIAKPSLLLLDEPFSKLDIDTRYEMYSLLQELWKEFHQTLLVVTHDLHEAILLGTRILVSTPLPFRIRRFIEVPFQYPRMDSTTHSQHYTTLLQDLKESLGLMT